MNRDMIKFFGLSIKRENMKSGLSFLIGANLMATIFMAPNASIIVNIIAIIFCSLAFYGYSRKK